MRTSLGLALIGSALVYQDPNGNIVVDEDSLTDDPDFAGEYEDDDYYVAGEYEDDYEDDDLEFGRRRLTRDQKRLVRRQRQDQRRGRRRLRQDMRSANRGAPTAGVPVVNRGPQVQGAEQGWGNTMIGGDVTIAVAGTDEIVIRLQHDFLASDITFEGSASGAKVHSIKFGDETVFDSSTGVATAVFAPGSQMRKHLAGRSIKAGLDITIRVETAGADQTVAATLTGKKPVLSSC